MAGRERNVADRERSRVGGPGAWASTGGVELDSLTAAVEAVELSRICREMSRIAVELSSRGSDVHLPLA